VKRYTEPFVARYHGRLATHVESTLLRLGFCRTAAMKGRTYRCVRCDSTVNLYNSCTDRHCPQCMGARRADWVDKTATLVNRAVTYFQVVFTIPDKLSSLVLGNRRPLYTLLFHASWRALQARVRAECRMDAAATMVLHTWNQRLEHHPHVHALVPGSGPSLDGQRWVPCRWTKGTRRKPAKPFLVDNKRLGRAFRDHYLAGVRRLVKAGELQVQDLAALEQTLLDIETMDWVVYIQPPPKDSSDPQDVVKYLARYMTGGPISSGRLIEVKDDRVHFWARSKDKSGRTVRVSYSGVEFMQHWCLHILPKGFTKVRCYGGWSNTRGGNYLSLCASLSPATPEPVDESTGASEPAEEAASEEGPRCPQCESPMELESQQRRPSWRDLFYGPDHPTWIEGVGSG